LQIRGSCLPYTLQPVPQLSTAPLDDDVPLRIMRSLATVVSPLQDNNARVMAFQLRKPGFMKQFEGFWRMEELPGNKGVSLRLCCETYIPCLSAPVRGECAVLLNRHVALHAGFISGNSPCSCALQGTYAVLHQNILPCVSAPGLNWLVTKVCRAQIENMLRDLKQEIQRVNKGAFPRTRVLSVLDPWPAADVDVLASIGTARKLVCCR
jgi:hypothetical protein